MVNGGIITKREIVETVYEYDGEGKLIKKTVTQTKEEDENRYSPITTTNPCIINTTPYKATLDTNNDSICTSPIITCCKKQD